MSKTTPDNDTAQRIIAEAQIIRLTREDQIRVAESLINPPKANARLTRAAKTHARLIAPR